MNPNDPKKHIKLICPDCNQENKLGVAFCAHCGFAFNNRTNSTVMLLNQTSAFPEESELEQLTDLYAEGLILYMVGSKQSLILNVVDKITLGRKSAEDETDVDLTAFDGHILGISRKHALIHADSRAYYLEDLGSSNGTFINEENLAPFTKTALQNGDMIRLGQMIIYAYFKEKKDKQTFISPTIDRITEHNVLLCETGDTTDLTAADGVPVKYLYNRVLPFLKALQELQSAIDKTHNRYLSKFDIGGINVNKNRDGIEVNLIAQPEAIIQAAQMIAPWKRQHKDDYIAEHLILDLLNEFLIEALPEEALRIPNSLLDRLFPFMQVLCTSSLELVLI